MRLIKRSVRSKYYEEEEESVWKTSSHKSIADSILHVSLTDGSGSAFFFFFLYCGWHLYIFGNNHFGPGFDSKVEKKKKISGPHYLEAYNRRAALTRKVEFDQIKCISLTIHHFTIVPLPNPREREIFKSVQAPPRHHHSLQRLLQPFFPNHLTSIPSERPGGRDPITSPFSWEFKSSSV